MDDEQLKEVATKLKENENPFDEIAKMIKQSTGINAEDMDDATKLTVLQQLKSMLDSVGQYGYVDSKVATVVKSLRDGLFRANEFTDAFDEAGAIYDAGLVIGDDIMNFIDSINSGNVDEKASELNELLKKIDDDVELTDAEKTQFKENLQDAMDAYSTRMAPFKTLNTQINNILGNSIESPIM